jgi:hypothetical protein
MNPNFKKALVPSYKNGSILQLDIISAEPKIAWLEADNEPIKDVYEELSCNVFNSYIDRATAKKVVLCALYGQSQSKLQEQLPSNLAAKDVVRLTREKLKYEKLLEKLRSTADDKIRNAFGRPLRIKSNDQGPLQVSHYLQSTAAEASIIAFDDFVQRFDGTCKAIYVIHDALIIDCNAELTEKLLKAKNLKLKGGKYILHAAVERCS